MIPKPFGKKKKDTHTYKYGHREYESRGRDRESKWWIEMKYI